MDLLNKIKNYFNKKSTVVDEKEQLVILFDVINKKFNEFKDDYEIIKDYPELVKKKTKETEQKLLSLINENPKVLRIVGSGGYNLPMLMVNYGFEEIVSMGLDDEIVSTQQCGQGLNLGMICAMKGYEDLTIKALSNPVASTQQCNNGYNIGMYAAGEKMEKAVMIALDNPEASIQQSNNTKCNIGMYAVEYGLEDCVLKALDNKEASIQVNKDGSNIGICAARKLMERATMKALDNHQASSQQDIAGDNIGMIAAMFGLEDCTIKALENKEAALQQDNMGYTIGLTAFRRGLKSAVEKCFEQKETLFIENCYGGNLIGGIVSNKWGDLIDKILDDDELATHQTKAGYNAAMFLAGRYDEYFDKYFEKSLKNEVARNQVDNYGYNALLLAADKKMRTKVEMALNYKDCLFAQTNKSCNNIGMICIKNGWYDLGVKLLDYPELATQQNEKGRNMGMMFAIEKHKEGTMKALSNKTASLQQSNEGKTIGMYALNSRLHDCVKKSFEYRESWSLQDLTGNNLAMFCVHFNNDGKYHNEIVAVLEDKVTRVQRNKKGENLLDKLKNFGEREIFDSAIELGYIDNNVLEDDKNKYLYNNMSLNKEGTVQENIDEQYKTSEIKDMKNLVDDSDETISELA